MVIDLSVLSPYLSELEEPLTAIYQTEYMQDYDMTSEESMKIRASDDRVRLIQAKCSLQDGSLSIRLYRDDIPVEHGSVWESNANKRISSIAPTLVQEFVADHISLFDEQIRDAVIGILQSALGGALS